MTIPPPKRKSEGRKPLLEVPKQCAKRTCRQLCADKISPEQRQEINKQYWSIPENTSRRIFLSSKCRALRQSTTFSFFLPNDTGVDQQVCQTFLLSTLGYSSNKVIQNLHSLVWEHDVDEEGRARKIRKLVPPPDMRGKQASGNKISEENLANIHAHINSYHPQASHYQRVNAPNRRYISSDVTTKEMFENFCEQFPNVCGRTRYLQELKKLNITTCTPKLDQCDTCRIEKKLGTPNFLEHQRKYTEARKLYESDKLSAPPPSTDFFSVDLQKVLLPRMSNKTAIFTPRLVTFNETFARLGGPNHSSDSYCVMWHEAIQGRSADDIASSYIYLISHRRDTKHFVFWVDNCAAQNKSWILLSSILVFLHCNTTTLAETVTLRFLTAGHTSMSADSVHGTLELAMKKKGEIHDFQDLLDVFSRARSGLSVLPLEPKDFPSWSSQRRAPLSKNLAPFPNLSDCVEILLKKDSENLFWKTSFSQPFSSTLFFKRKPSIEIPLPKAQRGVSAPKLAKIVEKLVPLIPETRKAFWGAMKSSNARDLLLKDL